MNNIKGKIKLILEDIKTGETKEIKKENYITNLLLYALQYFQNSSNIFTNHYEAMDFFYSTNGIILLADTQPSSGKYAVSGSDTVVGYANNEVYSGEDVLRGSFNELESGFINPTKYRAVWDFGTNVAVGTIRAVARVPQEQYNLGYYGVDNLQAITGKGTIGELGSNESASVHNAILAISKDYGLFDNTGAEDYINWDTLYITKFAHNNVFTARLSTNLLPSGSRYLIPFALTEPIPSALVEGVETEYSKIHPVIDNDYIYILFYLSGVGFRIHRYDITTGLFVDETTYNFAYTANPSKFHTTVDEIIYNNGSTLYILDKSTLTETALTMPFAAGAISINQSDNDKVLITSDTTSDTAPFIVVSISTASIIKTGSIRKSPRSSRHGSYFRRGCNYYDTFNDIDFVFIHSKTYGAYYSSRYFDCYTGGGFLSEGVPLNTISNLSTPITKGADQALKIIYDFEF